MPIDKSPVWSWFTSSVAACWFLEWQPPQNAYIETTSFEKMYGMKQDFDLLESMRGDLRPLSGVEVAMAYMEGEDNGGRIESAWTPTLRLLYTKRGIEWSKGLIYYERCAVISALELCGSNDCVKYRKG